MTPLMVVAVTCLTLAVLMFANAARNAFDREPFCPALAGLAIGLILMAVGLLLTVLALTPGIASAQIATPGEKADSLMERAESADLPYDERSRLAFEALVEWYEEGARAVLTGDRQRLIRAVEREGDALIFGHRWALRSDCPGRYAFVFVPRPVSYLAYALGRWEGQGATLNSGELANLLLEAAEYRRRNIEYLRRC